MNEVVRINAEARDRAMGMSMVVLGLVALLGLGVSLKLPKGRLRPESQPAAADVTRLDTEPDLGDATTTQT